MKTQTKKPVIEKKLAVKPKSALALVPEAVAPTVQHALAAFAGSILSANTDQLAYSLDQMKQWTKALSDLKDLIDERLEKEILAHGHTVTEAGTYEMVTKDSTILRAQPTRTGYDPKKLENLLRENNFEPAVAMDATVTFKVNKGKLEDFMRSDKGMTEADLVPALYDTKYQVRLWGKAADGES